MVNIQSLYSCTIVFFFNMTLNNTYQINTNKILIGNVIVQAFKKIFRVTNMSANMCLSVCFSRPRISRALFVGCTMAPYMMWFLLKHILLLLLQPELHPLLTNHHQYAISTSPTSAYQVTNILYFILFILIQSST